MYIANLNNTLNIIIKPIESNHMVWNFEFYMLPKLWILNLKNDILTL